MCICIQKYTIQTCILIHAKTCFILLYQNISQNRFALRLCHSFHFSSAHESDINFTEFQIHVKSMIFIHLIWLFYKILHICNRSYWWYTYTCIHARMYACMCMYVRICMYMPARVYEFFGTEKPNFPFTRR